MAKNAAYEALTTQISEYVQSHIDQEIVIDDLALNVGVSKYHLNRIFQAVTGFQLGEFIQRRRLQTAYALLAKGNCAVIDVSLAVGYQSHSAFSRAFLNAFGCNPSDVKLGAECQWRTPDTLKKARDRDSTMQPEILERSTQHFRGLYGAGFRDSSFEALGITLFNELSKRLHTVGLGERYTSPIGVSLDSPWQGDQAQTRFFLGIAAEGLPAQLSLDEFIWREGWWARFYHKGSYRTMWQTISRVYAGWIVPEQISLRDETIVQAYLNSPKNTPEADLMTAIHFPVNMNRTFCTVPQMANH